MINKEKVKELADRMAVIDSHIRLYKKIRGYLSDKQTYIDMCPYGDDYRVLIKEFKEIEKSLITELIAIDNGDELMKFDCLLSIYYDIKHMI